MPVFPALAFCRDVGRHAESGRERLTWFINADDFSTCTSWSLKRGERLGMVLVDAAGRCWQVMAVTDHGVVRPFWERILRFLTQQTLHRIDQNIVEIETLPLQQLKERVAAAIQANPDDWRDDEAIAGEAGPPRDEQELLDEMKAAVRAAASVPQILSALYEGDFEG